MTEAPTLTAGKIVSNRAVSAFQKSKTFRKDGKAVYTILAKAGKQRRDTALLCHARAQPSFAWRFEPAKKPCKTGIYSALILKNLIYNALIVCYYILVRIL